MSEPKDNERKSYSCIESCKAHPSLASKQALFEASPSTTKPARAAYPTYYVATRQPLRYVRRRKYNKSNLSLALPQAGFSSTFLRRRWLAIYIFTFYAPYIFSSTVFASAP